MLETLDHTIRIGSTPTFLYFAIEVYHYYTITVIDRYGGLSLLQ